MSKMCAEQSNPTMDVAFQNIYEAPQALKDGLVVAPMLPSCRTAPMSGRHE